jgi:serine/threonine-protein kinase
MTVSRGTRVGEYEVTDLLGAGGMGEVWRARDTRLGRDVALKVLPAAFAADPDRVARFAHEARVLASINHPNIATIHGVEESGGVTALVMELVDGVTLADRTGRALPLAEALAIARQIADALDAAHERGIIHRDLKPANIKISSTGLVKVLDFGLAKIAPDASADGQAHQSLAPTMLPAGTQAGVILGTAAYMSPEQARGVDVDKRTDVWAFGCVLYEMLTGRAAFSGPTLTDVLSAVVATEPDWSALPNTTPSSVRRLLPRCLEKDPRRRLRDIGDARADLDDSSTTPAGSIGPVHTFRSSSLWWSAAIAVAVVAGAIGWFAHRRLATTTPDSLYLSISFPQHALTLPFGSRRLAISPDGNRIAYVSPEGLWMRRLDRKEAVAIGAPGRDPFFSPDGRFLGLFTEGTGLVKVPVEGGQRTTLAANSQRPGGGAWGSDGTIVFATTEGLFQIPADGGSPRLLAKPNRDRRERLYAWPDFLPGNRSIIFTSLTDAGPSEARIVMLDLDSSKQTTIIEGASSARYVPTGHLVYAAGPSLRAVAFDTRTGATHGEALSLSGLDLAVASDNGAIDVDISRTGTLVYGASGFAGPNPDAWRSLRALEWVDHTGARERIAIQPGAYQYPRVSPDGTRVALDVLSGGNRDVWILNLARLTLTQLTSGPTEDMLPLWSRDGRRVFFASDRAGNFDVYSQSADGAADARPEFVAPEFQAPNAITPDGKKLLVYDRFADLDVLNLDHPDRLEPLLHGPADERVPAISPDGRWMLYESDESGQKFEVFLRPFPNVSDSREKISIDGGRYPRWAPDGRTLYYVSADGDMMTASVTLSPALKVGPVTKLMAWQKPSVGRSGIPYDISPIDGRFLTTVPVDAAPIGPTQISVILNWFAELTRK